ncbi:GNAT family N-acetyltransferase [Candidatus Marinimicrobia bacterium]|nr:GNAT family N-acetyltransferase [Candidatus Neomarinimicrobiota bacterium]
MNVQKVSFIEVSYTNNNDIRILNAILSSWFSDPKILHFTAPNHQYPFKISKWISLSYTDQNIITFCLKLDNWIIGHISMKLNAEEKSAHLFHLIIDEKYRNKGYAKRLVRHVEKELIDKEKFNRLSLNCVKKNRSALALYQSLGFSIVKEKKHIKMVKDLK